MTWNVLNRSRWVQVAILMTRIRSFEFLKIPRYFVFPASHSVVTPPHTTPGPSLALLPFLRFINQLEDHQRLVEVLLVSDHWRRRSLWHICPDAAFFLG